MDLSDMLSSTVAAESGSARHPPEMLAQLGAEVSGALSTALERVTTLASSGRIDRASLAQLRREIESARRAGMTAQQLGRLASGRLRPAREAVSLSELLRAALQQRGAEIQAHGIEVRQRLLPVEIDSDTTMLFALLQAVLDWSFEQAHTAIELELAPQAWLAQAELSCRFAHRPPDTADSAAKSGITAAAPQLDSMAWWLLHQTAAALGVGLRRDDGPGHCRLTLVFRALRPAAPPQAASGDASSTAQVAPASSRHSKPLAGHHVLVLSSRRDLRQLVRHALQPQGLMIDYVNSVEEAREFCAAGLPHALVHEAALGGDRFERLRAELLPEAPGLVFIQLAEQGRQHEVLNVAGRRICSVGRDAIAASLAVALRFELARRA